MSHDGASGENSLSRRRFLHGLGSAAAGVTLAGCGSRDTERTQTRRSPRPRDRTSVETPTQQSRLGLPGDLTSQFGSVVNLAERGADPGGGESIVPHLEDAVSDDTLVYLPEGRYRMDERWRAGPFSNVGVYADGATIVPGSVDPDQPLIALGGLEGSRRLHVEGLNFDFREAETGPPPIFALVDDGLVVRDLSVAGRCNGVRLEVMSAGGSGRVERLRLPDGAFDRRKAIGCLVSKHSQGDIVFEDCHVEGFPNNGLYASNANGRVRVVDGTYANNGISNVRVGDGDLVRDVTVRCDASPRGFENMRGIWMKGTGGTLENGTVHLREVTSSDGAVVLGGTTTVRDTRIEIDTDNVAAVLGNDPNPKGVSATGSEGATQFQRVEVRGTASRGSAVTMIDHDRCTFDTVSIRQSGANRNGFRFVDVEGATVRESSVDVTGEPFVLQRSTVVTPDVKTAI